MTNTIELYQKSLQNKMYILVRQDLPPSIQTVQVAHVATEFMMRCYSYHDCDYPPVDRHYPNWDNGTMVFLGVKDEKELKHWMSVLKEAMYKDAPRFKSHFGFETFDELELGLTALSTDLYPEFQHLLKDLPLL